MKNRIMGLRFIAVLLVGLLLFVNFSPLLQAEELATDNDVEDDATVTDADINDSDIEVEEVFGDTAYQAVDITFGKKYTKELYDDSPRWFKFTLKKSGKVTVNSEFYYDYSSIIYFYQADDLGKCIQSSDLSYNDNLGHCILKDYSFDLLAGTYYVKYENYYHAYSGSKLFTLKISLESSKETFTESYDNRNDYISTAKKINAGKVYTGAFIGTQNDDVDFYKIYLNKKTTVRLSLTARYKYPVEFSIVDTYGEEEWRKTVYVGNNDVEKTATFDVTLNKGTHYIKACTYNYSYGIYRIKYVDVSTVPISMYRLYNPNSGEHFYTASVSERNDLEDYGWKYEGVAWKAPKKSNTPVYRLYNPNSGDHHYTTSTKERNNLISAGWSYEGIGWYSDDNKGVPLYRLYNRNAIVGSHHYTTSKAEKNRLVNAGWKYEGIAWYGMK